MTVLFSQARKYSIRALVEMARHPEKSQWSVFNLAKDLGIPPPFLAKNFQLLAKSDILISMKGRQGGFSFAQPPDNISVIKVVEAIDGTELIHQCTLGIPECGDDNPCSFHFDWKRIRAELVDVLSSKSIAQFAREIKQ
ncbi:MAG: RrF2 family transcriptional regulator [bacterium]